MLCTLLSLRSLSAWQLSQICLPPWDSNTSSGNPFHDIITLLMRCCCCLLLLLRAHCKCLQCYSAHSACYSVLAVLKLFYVFSKVSCFMLILMNIKNKLKCENNYLIRDQNNLSFIAEIVEFYVLRPGDKRQIQLRGQLLLPPALIVILPDPRYLLFWRLKLVLSILLCSLFSPNV